MMSLSETTNKKRKIPEGYKQTAVGIIPEEWDVTTLGNAVKFLDGKRKPLKESDRANMPGQYPYYGASGIIDYVNDYIFDEALILLGEDGANIVNRSTPLAFKVSGKIWVNNHAHVLKPSEIFEIGYLVEFLESIKYDKYNTGTAQPKLNKDICTRIPLPLPPLPEQQKIATILTTWDEAIEKTQKLIDQLKQRNKGLAQQLLTGKKRLKGFSGEWKYHSYEKILKRVKRPVVWNDSELYKLISVRRRSGGIFFRDALYGYQIKVKNLHTAKAGDFLFSKMQIVHGASALVTPEFDDSKISGSYISVRATNESVLSMEFLNWYSKLPEFYHQTFVSSYGVHIEKMTFDFDVFLAEKIKLPAVPEQQAIVKVLNQADQELKLYEQKLASFQQQKKGLMQKLLTGEVRVKINLK